MSLSYSEVRAILTQTGEPLQRDEVIEFLQIVDEDQDGMLHIEELMKARPCTPTLCMRTAVHVAPCMRIAFPTRAVA